MVENTILNYEEALANFYISQKDLDKLENAASKRQKQLQNSRSHLQAVRYQIVYDLIEKAGLAVCSAEIITWEFKHEGHRKFEGLNEAEKLGLFPRGQLRYLYYQGLDYTEAFDTPIPHIDTHILLLCPHHFPEVPDREITFPEAPHYQPIITRELTQTRDGKFFSSLSRKEITAPYRRGTLPEAIFEYFKIPPLPKKP